MLHHMLRAAAQRAFNVLDPYFQYVTMLLHGDGTNGAQNNTFLDSSTNNFSITRNGNTTQGTFTPYGSNWSNYFNGSSSLSISSANTVLPTGTQDFSVELFVNWQTQSGSYPQIISNPTTNGFQIYYDVSAGALAVGIFNVANVITYTIAQSTLTGAWTHIAVTRSGNTFRLFVNGVLQSNGTNTISFASPTTQYIASDGSRPYTGYISNVRTVLGSIPTAYQTSSTTNGTSVFTPSTTPLTAVSGTALLTCADNRFIDDSTNAFAITVNGSPSVQRFSPFSPTTAYSTSVIGGSGYFDGSGDSLLVSANTAIDVGSGDFTINVWAYPFTKTNGVDNIFGYGNYTMMLYHNNTNWTLEMSNNGSSNQVVITAPVTLSSWQYISIVKSGTTVTLYTNAVSRSTGTISGSVNTSGKNCEIGANGLSTGQWFTGYISNYQLIKGSAVTPTLPTAPSTTVSGTSLLLNFTNAGILDNAMMNDLETVGNAQISTSVKKYGTGSMYFDGTGDYLLTKSNPNVEFGSGSFTIELWLNLNAVPSGSADFWRSTNSGSGFKRLNFGLYDNILDVNYFGTQIIAATYSWSTGAWYHVALVRNGNTWNVYVNGVSQGSATNTNTLDSAAAYTTGQNINGYIDDLRITKGVARYTTTFTPPTAAFPNN